jgi:hypothetical protein
MYSKCILKAIQNVLYFKEKIDTKLVNQFLNQFFTIIFQTKIYLIFNTSSQESKIMFLAKGL